ncbi:hypothetical protein H206_05352 [Candidatus Electrothrix aarhusensis]|uniref:Uncharacterized protein n=1 Tax=Candidatus Electrothrix aarhusensis TaxID=1859131 RepID=A0A3S3RU52_9BACT|nr:hypothetical protein H206_05352 [Candidatus Electrothrix aarhusensis]
MHHNLRLNHRQHHLKAGYSPQSMRLICRHDQHLALLS